MLDSRPGSPPSLPFWRRPLVRWAASGTVLALLLLLLPFDDLVSAFSRISVKTWALALPLYLGCHMLGVLKWRSLVNAAGGGLSFRSAVRCYCYGLFGNMFLPSVAGGDFLRAGLAVQLAHSASGVVVGSVVDRILDLAALAAVAGFGVALLPRALDWRATPLTSAGAALALLAGTTVCAAAAVLPLRSLPRRLRRPWARAVRSLRTAREQPLRLAAALALGISLQTSLVLLNAWLGSACGIEIAWAVWLFVWPIAKLSAMLPITQGGLGVREAALAALFAPFGVPAGLVVAAGLVFQSVVISGGLMAGGLAHLLGRAEQRR